MHAVSRFGLGSNLPNLHPGFHFFHFRKHGNEYSAGRPAASRRPHCTALSTSSLYPQRPAQRYHLQEVSPNPNPIYNPKAARWRPTHSVTALGSSLYRSQLYPYRGLQRYHATLTQAQPQALTLTARPRLRRPRRANACAEPRARLTRRETEGASPRVAQMPTLDSTKLMSKQL